MSETFDPDWTSRPGETLCDLIDESDITIAEMASRCGMRLSRLEGIANGSVEITRSDAMLLARGTRISADFWESRERHYREDLARGKREFS